MFFSITDVKYLILIPLFYRESFFYSILEVLHRATVRKQYTECITKFIHCRMKIVINMLNINVIWHFLMLYIRTILGQSYASGYTI